MAELRYTYLLDVKDRASRQVQAANERIERSTAVANRAMERQGTVAQTASRQIASAGAKQAAEWKQVARAAQTAEREVAQAATQASTAVSKALERQVAAQRKAGESYAQIARQQKAAGVSARETAAAIEASAVKERRALEGTAAATRKAHGSVAGSFKNLTESAKGMAGGLAAGFAAFQGLSFLKDAVTETEELAKATLRLQRITGGDTKTASEWVVLAKERGVSAQQLNRAFITMERNQTKATQGTKVSAEAFKTLGISQATLKRSSPQQLIDRVADGLHRLGPGAKSATVAQQLFGRATQSLLPVLLKGGTSLRQLREELGKQGAAMDKNGVKKALELAAAQRKLNAQFLGLKLTVGQAIIPYLTKGAQALSGFITQMRNGTGTGGQVRRVFEQMGTALGQLGKALGPVVKSLAQAFGPAAKVASTAIQGMTQIIRSLVGVVRGVVGVVTHLISGDFAGAWRSVKDIVRNALSGIGGLVKAMMAPVYTAVSGAVGSAIKAVAGLGAGIGRALGSAASTVGRAAASVATSIFNAFRTIVNRVVGLFRSAFSTVRSIIGSIRSAVGSVTSIPGKVLDSINPFGRAGGVVGPGGFARYQDGGVVPAMLSPGEMVVHGGRGMIVPGRPVAADTVPMMLPVGSAVLTGDGQRRMAAGASLGEAIASQAPHFRTGGSVRAGNFFVSGPVSTFGPPGEGAGSTAYGGSSRQAGIALNPHGGGSWNDTLARSLRGLRFHVRIGSHSAVLPVIDKGPSAIGRHGARLIDVTGAGARRMGINPNAFPTDAVGTASLDGRGGTGGTAGYSITSYSPRGRLITSGRAAELGFEAGLTGGSLYGVYSSLRDSITFNRTVTQVPGSSGAGGGGAGGGSMPPRVAKMIRWADGHLGRPYGHAGGHGAWEASNYDCSGYVGGILHAGGFLNHSITADGPGAGIARFGAAGVGRWITIADRGSSNATGHTMIRVAGRYYESGGGGPYGAHKTHRTPGWDGKFARFRHPVGYRVGGAVGPGVGNLDEGMRRLQFFQGGGPVALGPPVRQPTTGASPFERTIALLNRGQDMLMRAGAHDNQRIAAGLHMLDQAIQRVHIVSYARLTNAAKILRQQIAAIRGDNPALARRLLAELRLTIGEMGRRIGLMAKEAADMVDPTTRAAVHVERILQASKGKITLTSNAALGQLDSATKVSQATLEKAIGELQRAYQRAQKLGLRSAMHQLAGRIADLMTQLVGVINDARAGAVEAMGQIADTARTRLSAFARQVNAGLQIAGIDPQSGAGLLARYKVAGKQQEQLQKDLGTLQEWRKWAAGSGNTAAVTQLNAAILEQQTLVAEGLGTLADLARQGKGLDPNATQVPVDNGGGGGGDGGGGDGGGGSTAADQMQAAIDAAVMRVSVAQGGLQHLGLEQQLAGTYDTGGQARADYILKNIVPAIQAEIATLQSKGASADQVIQAQNDLLQAQLDAQDAIKQNTEDTANALQNLGGTLGFEFQGQRLTDDLYASGVGA